MTGPSLRNQSLAHFSAILLRDSFLVSNTPMSFINGLCARQTKSDRLSAERPSKSAYNSDPPVRPRGIGTACQCVEKLGGCGLLITEGEHGIKYCIASRSKADGSHELLRF